MDTSDAAVGKIWHGITSVCVSCWAWAFHIFASNGGGGGAAIAIDLIRKFNLTFILSFVAAVTAEASRLLRSHCQRISYRN